MIINNQYDPLMHQFGDNFTFFLRGPFGQWFRRKIVVDGVEYNCNEQFMMAEKARLFNDQEAWEKIMSEKDPAKQKGLGRTVKNFNQQFWDGVARDVVFIGNYAKFTQHEDFNQALMKTKGTLLVEANPRDTIWGIGLEETDPRCKNQSTWLGKNWLGQVLTCVRETIIRDRELQSLLDKEWV